MLDLSARQRLIAGLGLALLLAATRGQHSALLNLPSASWAVFFLAGVLLPARWSFPALFLGAVGLDLAGVAWGGASNHCLTLAYWMLLPAYASLWLGGRLYARLHRLQWGSLSQLAGCLLGASLIAHLCASGGFYFLSGRFAEPDLAGLLARIATYYPGSLQVLVAYVAVAALLLGLVHGLQRRALEVRP